MEKASFISKVLQQDEGGMVVTVPTSSCPPSEYIATARIDNSGNMEWIQLRFTSELFNRFLVFQEKHSFIQRVPQPDELTSLMKSLAPVIDASIANVMGEFAQTVAGLLGTSDEESNRGRLDSTVSAFKKIMGRFGLSWDDLYEDTQNSIVEECRQYLKDELESPEPTSFEIMNNSYQEFVERLLMGYCGIEPETIHFSKVLKALDGEGDIRQALKAFGSLMIDASVYDFQDYMEDIDRVLGSGNPSKVADALRPVMEKYGIIWPDSIGGGE
jgi:hypothetical protein